jgi:hypothetical protein
VVPGQGRCVWAVISVGYVLWQRRNMNEYLYNPFSRRPTCPIALDRAADRLLTLDFQPELTPGTACTAVTSGTSRLG